MAANQHSLPDINDILGNSVNGSETISLPGQLYATIIMKPGMSLDRTIHGKIYRALVSVSTLSFGADMQSYWLERSVNGYLERLYEFTLVHNDQGALVGWTGFHVIPYADKTLVYLDSTGMIPSQQSKGSMRCLFRQRISALTQSGTPTPPVYLCARSESPVVYKLMASLLGDQALFPNPKLPAPANIVDTASLLAEWLGQLALLNSHSLKIEGAYENLNQLYADLPTSGNADLDSLFRSHLGPLDAYLLVGKLY